MNIRKLILQGEGTTLDFKKTITNNEKIAKSLVAFANNKGGQLLIGVADDGSIKGVKSEDEDRFGFPRPLSLARVQATRSLLSLGTQETPGARDTSLQIRGVLLPG